MNSKGMANLVGTTGSGCHRSVVNFRSGPESIGSAIFVLCQSRPLKLPLELPFEQGKRSLSQPCG